MKKVSLLFVVLTFLAFDMTAQVKTPSASPSSKVSQTIGLTEFALEYSRPSMKGRAIFGEGDKFLVQYGKTWRTGANRATKLSFDSDVTIGGVEMKKGTYAILTVPQKGAWEVQFHKYESSSWSSYADKEPAAIVKAEAINTKHEVETFTMSFQGLEKAGQGRLEILWSGIIVTLPIDTKADATVMKSIDKLLAGPSNGDYYNIGSYYYSTGRDMEKALEYVQKSTKVEKPKFWQVRREALILAELKKYKEAIKVAEKSLALAKEAGNDDYVKMNKASIAEWMKMK
jgi:tetratricopeptide (TPR) repeat protein